MSILTVRVVASPPTSVDKNWETRGCCQLLFEEAFAAPHAVWEHVEQLGRSLLMVDPATRIRLTFFDDDGDSCTLCKETTRDALAFAKEKTESGEEGLLEVLAAVADVSLDQKALLPEQCDEECTVEALAAVSPAPGASIATAKPDNPGLEQLLQQPLLELAQALRSVVGELGHEDLFVLLDPISAIADDPSPLVSTSTSRCLELAEAYCKVPEEAQRQLHCLAGKTMHHKLLPVFLEQLLALSTNSPEQKESHRVQTPRATRSAEERLPQEPTAERTTQTFLKEDAVAGSNAEPAAATLATAEPSKEACQQILPQIIEALPLATAAKDESGSLGQQGDGDGAANLMASQEVAEVHAVTAAAVEQCAVQSPPGWASAAKGKIDELALRTEAEIENVVKRISVAKARLVELQELEAQIHRDVVGKSKELSLCEHFRSKAAVAEALALETQAKLEQAVHVTEAVHVGLEEKLRASEQLVKNLSSETAILRAELGHSKHMHQVSEQAASAHVVGGDALMLVVEAEEDIVARGDITSELAADVAAAGARQAYRLGRVRLPASACHLATHTGDCDGLTATAPVCACVTLVNDGEVAWPATAVLAHVAGKPLGLPLLPLGPVAPGDAARLELDFVVPLSPPQELEECGGSPSTRSTWVIVDATTGTCFGPMLVLEVEWTAAS